MPSVDFCGTSASRANRSGGRSGSIENLALGRKWPGICLELNGESVNGPIFGLSATSSGRQSRRAAESSLLADYFAPIGNIVPWLHEDGTGAHIAGALLFLALAVILSRFARRKI